MPKGIILLRDITYTSVLVFGGDHARSLRRKIFTMKLNVINFQTFQILINLFFVPKDLYYDKYTEPIDNDGRIEVYK